MGTKKVQPTTIASLVIMSFQAPLQWVEDMATNPLSRVINIFGHHMRPHAPPSKGVMEKSSDAPTVPMDKNNRK
jgi:hypothetical protein